MSILVKKDNQWLSVKNIYCCQNNQWNTIKECYVRQSGIWRSIWKNAIIFINDSPQTSISIFELMGSPKKDGNFIFINNAEINANYGEPALRTGTFPSTSKLTIINNSFIRGYGGNGGSSSSDGEPGGEAIFIEYPCHINNKNGYLLAGGGGGGGFYVMYQAGNTPVFYKSGGGGGAGSISGVSGENHTKPAGGAYYGGDPTSGVIDSGGLGGFSGINFSANSARFDAGEGGNLGQPGESCKREGTTKTVEKLYAGGAAGLAINKNGFEVILLNLDEERIKGEIQ